MHSHTSRIQEGLQGRLYRAGTRLLASFMAFAVAGDVTGQVVLNEVCNANYGTIMDEYGEYRDWIELWNTDTVPAELSGYCLSDDPAREVPWCFPEYSMAPGEHLVVFASGRDIGSCPVYWETLIEQGDEWKYILPDADTPPEWIEANFNDSAWNTGKSGFGYGDNDDSTRLPQVLSVFIRKQFTVEDPSAVPGCVLHMDYDDAFVAYINGKEIARAGIQGNPPAHDRSASSSREAEMYSGGDPQKFSVADPAGLLQAGNNVLAIQVHNISLTSSDMTAIPFLSIQSPSFPASPPPAILDLSTTYFHTDFKLDAEGEPLYLMGPKGRVTDSVHIPWIGENNSFGRNPQDTAAWVAFSEPTPGEPNHATAFAGYVSRLPGFSVPGGRFTGPFMLSLSSAEAGDSIYYTLDGTEPDTGSTLYTEPLEIDANAIIRARIILTGYLPGDVVTHTYFSETGHGLAVISISTDPHNLWDYYDGIYVKGPNAQSEFPYFDANFWQDWERPGYIEVYEEDGSHAFSAGAGLKIYGGWTRGHPQKSVAFFARRRYGTGSFQYRLFGERPVTDFESFIIRNSGNDWYGQGSESGTMIRDILMTRMTRDMDLEYLAARQAVVYLNGEYWGVQNIREKVNEHYIASLAGIDPDRIDLLEGNQHILCGDNSHYAALIHFLSSNSAQVEANYAWAEKQMDIQNFINYQIAQIHYDNRDWPSNNVKYWRRATPKGKWRWILYDTDFGFGLWNTEYVFRNTLEFATEPNGPGYPNPPWATFLLRQLLRNQEFRERFVNSFADRINTSFSNDSAIGMIDELEGNIDSEMPFHAASWGGTYQLWKGRVEELRLFAGRRPTIMLSQLQSYFGLGLMKNLMLDVSDREGGYLLLNSLHLKQFPFTGVYFEDVPVELTAVSLPGYKFSGWEGSLTSSSPRIRVEMTVPMSITARFEPDPENPGYPVVINEICYTSDTVLAGGDWVELHNTGSQYIDLSGWILKDSDPLHEYTIGPRTILEPGGFLVICRDLMGFETVYPQAEPYQGEFDFGLSNDEDVIRLYDPDMEPADSVPYSSLYPWPVILPGTGYTLSLRIPVSDNSKPEAWSVSKNWLGTPGAGNQFNVGIAELPGPGGADHLYQNFPNPFSDGTRILFHSSMPQQTRVAVFDLDGRLLQVLMDGILDRGDHEFYWTPGENAGGIYLLRVITPRSVHTCKMIHSG